MNIHHDQTLEDSILKYQAQHILTRKNRLTLEIIWKIKIKETYFKKQKEENNSNLGIKVMKILLYWYIDGNIIYKVVHGRHESQK